MKVYRYLAVVGCLFALSVLLANIVIGEDTNTITNNVCSMSNPASTCAASNTCGSASSPCTIDIRRSQGTYATATPSIPGVKSNKPFCIKVGTAVTFSTSSKNTAFIIDFDKANPFDHQGAIIGGADRPITVTAKHPGCYSYSVGACTPGTVYGMCGHADTQLIISAN
jgi:plastocyanin